METCVWTYDVHYDFWSTDCGEAWFFDSSLDECRVRFCPGCGKLVSVAEEQP